MLQKVLTRQCQSLLKSAYSVGEVLIRQCQSVIKPRMVTHTREHVPGDDGE
jgi:hypothetical protein